MLVRKTTHEASSSTTCHTNSILGWCVWIRKMLRLFFGRYFYGIVYLKGCLLMPENRRNSFQLMTPILGRFQNKLKMTNPTTEKQQSGLCLFDAHTWFGFAFQRCSTPKRMQFWNNQSQNPLVSEVLTFWKKWVGLDLQRRHCVLAWNPASKTACRSKSGQIAQASFGG